MPGRLHGKRAFVTAAAQGIGRATALAFAREGAAVTATDVNEAKLKELAATPGLSLHRLDATNGAAIAALARDIGPVDILFNCAGWVPHGSVLDCSEADWDRAMTLNVKSMFWTMKAFLPGMIAQKRGAVINVASVASSVKGIVFRAAYGASKAAVIGLTKAVAADHVKDGVRCNAICPGTVETPSLGERINAFADPVAARAAFIARQPMGRLGTAEEVAELAVYMASDAAEFMTGQAVLIDGGITI